MQVVVVNLRYVGVRDNDERQIPEGLYPPCEAGWEKGQGEVRRPEEGLLLQRRASVPASMRLAGRIVVCENMAFHT